MRKELEVGAGKQRKLNDVDAVCPYFLYHTQDHIVCEGPVPDAHVRLIFESRAQKNLHYRAYCCQRCSYCEMYQAAMGRYTEYDPEE